MNNKFLDYTGLQTVISLIKGTYAEKGEVSLVAETATNAASVATQNADSIVAINENLSGNYYNKSEVDGLIGSIDKLTRIVVASKDEITEENVIYMVPKDGENGNVYEEFMLINGNIELIGNTEVDLTNYITTDDVVFATTDEIDALFV
jgi:hypothetical protein